MRCNCPNCWPRLGPRPRTPEELEQAAEELDKILREAFKRLEEAKKVEPIGKIDTRPPGTPGVISG